MSNFAKNRNKKNYFYNMMSNFDIWMFNINKVGHPSLAMMEGHYCLEDIINITRNNNGIRNRGNYEGKL